MERRKSLEEEARRGWEDCTSDVQHVWNEYERLSRDGECNHDSKLSSLSER